MKVGYLAQVSMEVVLLSVRQKQVLELVAEGKKVAEAAHELGIKPETVNAHLIKAREKLVARNNVHAVAIAKDRGLI